MKYKPLALIDGKISEVSAKNQLVTNNFSYLSVKEDEFVSIVDNQQMIVFNSVAVIGEVRVDGEMYVSQLPVIEPPPEPPADNFSFFEVVEFKAVPQHQEMGLSGFMRVESELKVDGQVSIDGFVEPESSLLIPTKINQGLNYFINTDFENYFRDFISIAGTLRVAGRLVVGV